MLEPQFLFQISRLEKSLEEVLIGQPHIDGAAHQAERFFQPPGNLQPARQTQQIRAMARMHIFGIAKSCRNQAREAGQRNNIEHVVMEHRNQPERKARAQVFEIVIRDQFARHIGLALEAEDLVFEIHQPAAFQTQFEQAARAVEKIEVLHAHQRDGARGDIVYRVSSSGWSKLLPL